MGANKFKKSVVWNFQHALRNFGDQRLFELTAGELTPRVDQSEECDSQAGSLRLPSPRGAPGNMLRVNSAPAGKLRSMQSGGTYIDLPRIEVPKIQGDKHG